MFINGNLHAHNMETDGMDDWTKKEDMEADERCPELCVVPGCMSGVEIALALGYRDATMGDLNHVHEHDWTPWQYFCTECAELFTGVVEGGDFASVQKRYWEIDEAFNEVDLQ